MLLLLKTSIRAQGLGPLPHSPRLNSVWPSCTGRGRPGQKSLPWRSWSRRPGQACVPTGKTQRSREFEAQGRRNLLKESGKASRAGAPPTATLNGNWTKAPPAKLTTWGSTGHFGEHPLSIWWLQPDAEWGAQSWAGQCEQGGRRAQTGAQPWDWEGTATDKATALLIPLDPEQERGTSRTQLLFPGTMEEFSTSPLCNGTGTHRCTDIRSPSLQQPLGILPTVRLATAGQGLHSPTNGTDAALSTPRTHWYQL